MPKDNFTQDRLAPEDLPETFDTLEEIAEFWETHALTDYESYLAPVEATVAMHPTHE